MAIAYESVSNTTLTTTTSLSINKPSGLAVGDYMFAHLWAQSGSAYTLPSGWTAIYNAVPNLSNVLSPCAVMYKEADSADVAASTFSFTNGSSTPKSGALLRVSGMGVVDDSFTSVVLGSAGSPQAFTPDIDPVWSNSLAIAFLIGGDNAINSIDFTDFDIATDNPTWTSRASDAYSNIAGSFGRRVYTAPRTQDTAWGNADVAYNQSGSGIGLNVVFVSLAPTINGSATVTTGTINIVNQPFLRTGALTLEGNDPTTSSNEPTNWSNESKGSTTWTNEQKL